MATESNKTIEEKFLEAARLADQMDRLGYSNTQMKERIEANTGIVLTIEEIPTIIKTKEILRRLQDQEYEKSIQIDKTDKLSEENFLSKIINATPMELDAILESSTSELRDYFKTGINEYLRDIRHLKAEENTDNSEKHRKIMNIPSNIRDSKLRTNFIYTLVNGDSEKLDELYENLPTDVFINSTKKAMKELKTELISKINKIQEPEKTKTKTLNKQNI